MHFVPVFLKQTLCAFFDEFDIAWSRAQKEHITALSLLNFQQGYEKHQIGSCPNLLYVWESMFTPFFSKKI